MTPTRPKPASPRRISRAATKAARARKSAAAKPDGGNTERQLKIGEAARLIGVEPYVLRFWETQFPFLRPRHSRSKHRYYDQKNLESLHLVKRLLHSEGYTIAGAKKHIREAGLDRLRAPGGESPAAAKPASTDSATADRTSELPHAVQHKLAAIREELKSLQKLLAS
jgi:DNA-binding transcriptional MerR regulator